MSDPTDSQKQFECIKLEKNNHALSIVTIFVVEQ